MNLDPLGKNSKDLEIQAITAAGGNSSEARRLRVKSQLRDRYGRWVEMGRDSKIKIRYLGKIIEVIGKFVGGSDREGYGRFLVENDPNGLPRGVYHFKGAALNQILASLDPEYLKGKGIKFGRDVNGNLIGDVMDADIEDYEDIKFEEVGELDEALSTGELDDSEKSQEVKARLDAPDYVSRNVVARIEDASGEDTREGAEVVRQALTPQRAEQGVPETVEPIEEAPVRRSESWYTDADGKIYSEVSVPDNLRTPENRRTWNPNTNVVVDGNGKEIPFQPTYDDKFNPLPAAGTEPNYSDVGYWDLNETDPYGTHSVNADEVMAKDPQEAYDALLEGKYVMVPNRKIAAEVFLMANREKAKQDAIQKELGEQPKPSKELLKEIDDELAKLNAWDRKKLTSAIIPKKLSAEKAQAFLDSLRDPSAKTPAGSLRTSNRRALIKDFRNAPIDATNMYADGSVFFSQNGMGVPRDQMPAVKSADHDVFEGKLKEVGIDVSFEEVPISELIQVQSEISADNVGGMVESILAGKFNPFVAKNGNPNPVYISSDNKVLDGHHRVAAALVAAWQRGETGDNLSIPVARIDLPYDRALTIMNEWGNAHGIEGQTLDKNRKGNLSEFFQESKEKNIENIFSAVEESDYEDMEGLRTGNTENENTKRLRDAILHAADLIEESGGTPMHTREQLYANLTRATLEHIQDLKEGVAYKPRPFFGRADTVQKITGRKEGATLDAETLSQPRKGISVALEGLNEEVIDSFFFADGIGDLLLADYVDSNAEKLLGGGFKLGTWHDKDNNEITFDVVELFPETDREEAIAAGQNRNQQGIFKISNKEYISTGGTGDRGRARREREKQRGESSLRPEYDEGGVGEPPTRAESGVTPSVEGISDEADAESRQGELTPSSYTQFFDLEEVARRIEEFRATSLDGFRGNKEVISELNQVLDEAQEKVNTGIASNVLEAVASVKEFAERTLATTDESKTNRPWDSHHKLRLMIRDMDWVKSVINVESDFKNVKIKNLAYVPIVANPEETMGNLPAFLDRLKTLGVSESLQPKFDEINRTTNPQDVFLQLIGLMGDTNNVSDRARRGIQDFINRNKKWKNSATCTGFDPFNPDSPRQIVEQIRQRYSPEMIIYTDPTGSKIEVDIEGEPDASDTKYFRPTYGTPSEEVEDLGEISPYADPELMLINAGSAENNNKEQVDEANYEVTGEDDSKQEIDEAAKLERELGAQRAAELKLETRNIDRSKMSERQKSILKNLISRRNKSEKSLVDYIKLLRAGGTPDNKIYNSKYNFALATTRAIKRLVGGVEEDGKSFNFGSGEEERLKNTTIIEDSFQWEGEPFKSKARRAKAYYTTKNGKVYLLEWNGGTATATAIKDDGTVGSRDAAYVRTSGGEYSWGPGEPVSASIGYLNCQPAHRGNGVAGAVVSFARYMLHMEGKNFAHSQALTLYGANNSKGIDRHNPLYHHLSQAEKVLHLMDAPAIELMRRVGWFSNNFQIYSNRYSARDFRSFLKPIQGKSPSYGAGDFAGPLYTLDNIMIATLNYENERIRRRNQKEDDVVANVDYPEFAEQFVKNLIRTSSYSSIKEFSLREILTEMSYKDGLSKEDGIAKLKKIRQDLTLWRSNRQTDANQSTDEENFLKQLDTLDSTIGQLISGLENWDYYDLHRIDRPKPFDPKLVKLVSERKVADQNQANPDVSLENEFVAELGLKAISEDAIGFPRITRYAAPPAAGIENMQGSSQGLYLDKFPEKGIPDEYLRSPASMAKRRTPDELKSALRDAVLNKTTDEDGFGVVIDHSRNFAEEKVLEPVSIADVLTALKLQGEDSAKILAEIIDEKNGNSELTKKLQSAREADTSVSYEFEKILENLGISNAEADAKTREVSYGGYDENYNVIMTNLPKIRKNSIPKDLYTFSMPYGSSRLLPDNEVFDFPSTGQSDVLGGTLSTNPWEIRRRDNDLGLPPGATSNPKYIYMAFNKDDLVAGFTRALMENKDKVNLVFPGDLIRGGQGYDRITSIPLTSIRDALQYHGVDTNALARKVFRETFDREEEDKKLKPSGRIVPRTPDEVLQEATNEIDCSGFIHKFYLGSGVNEPEVYEDPKDGKLYVLKHLDSRRSPTDDQRATDQEIATLAYYRAMGINANVACRGFIKNQDGERTDYIVTPYITSSSTLEDWRTMSAYPDITSEGNRVVKGVTNGLIADLFLDHVDGPFNYGNVVIDSDGNPVRIDGGGGLLWDPSPEEGLKHETDRYSYGGFGDQGNDGDEDQQWLRDIADTEGSFEGQGIEFGFDYFLNPDGWHWNPGNIVRKNMLKSTDRDQLKIQAEELLLNNMTPDKIDQVSRIIRNPYDRAKVVDALNYRRKEILKHFGIDDTYDPQTTDITNGVPSEHSLDDYFETVESLRLNLTNDQYKELIDFASKTDITQGQLSSKLQEIRSQQDLFNGNEKSAEQLIKETKKNLEKGLEEAKPDDSDFPTNGKVEESEISAVSPMRYEPRMLRYGDVVLDRKASVVGRVVFSNSLPEGKTYVGLIDGNGNFVEKTFDYNEPVWIDVSPRSREELSYNTGGVPAPAILNRLRARSNQVLEDVKAVYPDAKVLPNGDLIIASTEKRELTRRQRLFKYDVVVHRTPDEKFVTYVRRTELGDDRLPVGTPQVGRISVETHSSRHLLNRIAPLLRGKGNYKGILADQPHNWFSNSSDLQGEVLHPSTGQPIPFSLAPRNLNTQYIGDTGIEVTGDPIKDALISHVADLIDRGVSASEVLGRLNNQTVLNKNQVADIAERIQANRVFPGVNQIPYVSRDGSNIVRVGDRVRHFHPDGTIREGRVYRREPLIVNKKAPGDYGYTDVLRVRFDDGTYSPIVAKNLEILARSDGSSPDLGTAPAPRIPTAFRDPVGLPSNFRVKDAEFGRREFNHSEGSDSHSSGVVLPMSRGTNNEFFVAAVYGKGGSHGRSLPLDTFETKDKNLAQDWLVAKMAALEESYSGNNKIEGRKLQQGIDPFSNPEDLEEAMERDALSFGAGLENAVERTGESRVISKSQRKEMFSDTIYESSSEEFPDVLDENGNVTTPARTITTMKMVKVKGKDGKYISDEKLPVVQYIEEKVSGKKQVKYFLNRKTFADGKDYKSRKYTAAKQKENIFPVIDKYAKLRVVYDESGPHFVRLGGTDIEVPFEDYVALRNSKMTDKKMGDPTEGEPIILPEYIKEWESILKNHIDGVESRAEKEGKLDDKYGGKPYILYIGGMAGAGKTSGLFKKDKNGKIRVRDKEEDEGRDPEGVERPGLPIVKQYDSDGNVTEETKGLEKYEAVVINSDDIKTQLSEVRDMQARMRLEKVKGSGISRITRGKVKDENWASAAHEESSLLTKLITREAMRLKLDIIVDGVGDDTVEKLVKKIDVAKDKGYFTIGEYLDADWRRALISAAERAIAVFRVVPEDVLAKGAIGLAAMLFPQKQADGTTPRSLLSGVFDRFYLFGNGESSRRPGGVDTREEAAVMLGYSEGDGEFTPNGSPLAADMLAASRSRNSLLAPRKDKNMNEIIEELLTRMKQIKKEKQRTSTATKLISKEDTKDLSPEQKNHIKEVNAIQSVAAQTGLTPQQLMLIPGVGNALNMYSSGNITIEDILNLVISSRNKQ